MESAARMGTSSVLASAASGLAAVNPFSCNAGLSAIQSNWSGSVPPITNSDPISNYEQNATVMYSGYMGDYFVTVDSSTGDACSAIGLS